MHRRFYLLVALLFPILSFAQQWKSFTDTAGNFTAKYPSNWINKIKENNRVFFTSPSDGDADNFYENINIGVTTKAGYGTEIKIKDVMPGVAQTLKEQFDNFSQESSRYFKWNGADAAELIYTCNYKLTDETVKIRTTQWYCFYKSRLYVVTFVAEFGKSTYNSTALKIMNSIQFK